MRTLRSSSLAACIVLFASALTACNDGSRQPALLDDAGPAPSAQGSDDGGFTEDAEAEVSSDADDGKADVPGERPGLCAREADDIVRDIFCKSSQPSVTSLRELASRLGFQVLSVDSDEAALAALKVTEDTQIDGAVFMGHSTALSGQLVSPINPRVILLNNQTFFAFQRGVQHVEIATRDRAGSQLNFYLLSFEQACNARNGGCTPGDLYTLRVERDWTSVVLEDAEDLKNTPSDCRQCHQRGVDRPTLLMRELRGPWTHFFSLDRAEAADPDAASYDADVVFPGAVLMRDYTRAKGDESYAGVPAALIGHTVGATLQNAIIAAQPLDFDTPAIARELAACTQAGRPRRSAIWDQAYADFKLGEQLALPHFEPRPTDAAKQEALSQAYQRYLRGEIAAEALPDLADIFPDDPQTRAEIGLQTEPNATGAELLVQACGSCHNDVLDQTISRARFNIALSRMSRDELDLAITRIELSAEQSGVMPPPDARQLDAAGRIRLMAYLEQNQRSTEDDSLLQHAATIGMARPRADYPTTVVVASP